MPQPSSMMLDVWVRIEEVQRGLVSFDEIHSAIKGVIFQRTVFFFFFWKLLSS